MAKTFMKNHWTGDHQANCQIFCFVVNKQELDTMEGSSTSKTVEEPTRLFGIRGSDNVGALATLDSFVTTVGTETDRKRLMFGHLD
jgi:hypothetical protein